MWCTWETGAHRETRVRDYDLVETVCPVLCGAASLGGFELIMEFGLLWVLDVAHVVGAFTSGTRHGT